MDTASKIELKLRNDASMGQRPRLSVTERLLAEEIDRTNQRISDLIKKLPRPEIA